MPLSEIPRSRRSGSENSSSEEEESADDFEGEEKCGSSWNWCSGCDFSAKNVVGASVRSPWRLEQYLLVPYFNRSLLLSFELKC
jgi:hypothetical protein